MSIEISADGGVRIEGQERELRDLASHLLRAAVCGRAEPSFISDRAVTSIEIVRQEPA